jgi:hypothetical protein
MLPIIASGRFDLFQALSNVNDVIDIIEDSERSKRGLKHRKACQIKFCAWPTI